MSVGVFAVILCALAFGSALVAGVFQAFSDFLMRALKEVDDEVGMVAMQRINVTVFRSVFLTGFFVLVPGLLLGIWASTSAAPGLTGLLGVAAAIYFSGVVGVTVLRNVPMNERLDRLVRAQDRGAAAEYWAHYRRQWTRWNHVRSAASAATAGLLLAALLRLL